MSIERALQDSVQQLPDARTGDGLILATFRFGGETARQSLLPAWGTYARQRVLRNYWYHDYNTLFQGAIAGIVKRVQSTPWEISGPPQFGDYFQKLLQQSDFGDWDRFIAKLVTDFSRYDIGAFIEIIAPGDPLNPPTGPAVGLSILDPMYCFPTGDPEYPVLFQSQFTGGMHLLHRSRVVQFVDMPDSTTDVYGYGMCALSRAIAPVKREILMGRYIETKLDDQPPPGMAVFNNMTEDEYIARVENRDRENQTDRGSEWGRTVKVFGLDPQYPVTVDFVTYAAAPENFNYDTYKTINVREIALSIGLDIQDVWELSGAGIGTGTQSQVLAQKARGKALGRILKGLERVINRILPESAEFEFKYSDAQEDAERAQIATQYASMAAQLEGILTPDEIRQMLANQVEPIKDAITDRDGNIRRLDDADPKPENLTPSQLGDAPPQLPTETIQVTEDTKAIGTTRAGFARDFVDISTFGLSGTVTQAAVRMALRTQLHQWGRDALRDGLIDGGVENPTLGDDAMTALAEWRARQSNYITRFVDSELFGGKQWTELALRERAQVWVNMSINPMYYKGLELAAPNQRYLWIFDPRKEHCVTCEGLNGQVHLIKTYRSRNLLPQSRALVCGGWECGCRLQKTDLPARGRLRSVRYVRGRRELIVLRDHGHNHDQLQAA